MRRLAYYRLYKLSEKAHIEAVEAFDAPDDDAAIRKGDEAEGQRKELWSESRRVKQWMLSAP